MEKLAIIEEIKSLFKDYPQHTFMELMYEVSRPRGDESKSGRISDMLEISDLDVLTRIEKFREFEKDE